MNSHHHHRHTPCEANKGTQAKRSGLGRSGVDIRMFVCVHPSTHESLQFTERQKKRIPFETALEAGLHERKPPAEKNANKLTTGTILLREFLLIATATLSCHNGSHHAPPSQQW